MRPLLSVALLLAVVPIANAKQSHYFTGNDLHELCLADRVAVTLYVTGAVDETLYRAVSSTSYRSPFCLREGIRAGQLGDTICKRLSEEPEIRDLPAAPIVWTTLRAAFPCSP